MVGYQPLPTQDNAQDSPTVSSTTISQKVWSPLVRTCMQQATQKKKLKLLLLGTCIFLCGGFWVLVYSKQTTLITPKLHKIHRYILAKYTGDLSHISTLHPIDDAKLNSTFHPMIDRNYHVINNTCTHPINKVGFSKTHKTASSALQNILFRYGKEYNWTFALYEEGSQLGPPHNQYKLDEPFQSSWLDNLYWRPMVQQQGGYNAFAVHANWNKKEVEKILGKEAAYITILRNPVDQFESMYSYMRFEKHYNKTLHQFVEDVIKNEIDLPRVNSYLGRNQQFWDLGRKPRDIKTEGQVIKAIKEIEREFDLVLIAEDMESSLVLLSQVLCWPINHFTTLQVNTRKKSHQIEMSDEVREVLKEWLWQDEMLYTYFKQVLDRRKQNYGLEILESKVGELKKMNAQVKKVCVEGISNNEELSSEFKPWSNDIIGYKINESVSWCKYYGMVENRFIDLLRNTQRIRFQDWMLDQSESDETN